MKQTIGIVAALATAAFAAPLAAQGPGAAAGEGLVYPSGFLPDYARLKPVPGKEGRLAWLAPDDEVRGYKRFILTPLTITIDPDAQYRGIEADFLQRLAAIYQTAFARVLAPEYPVVDQPGPGVALCRFAITGVTPASPQFRPRDALPVVAAFRVVRAASGASARVARVSAEIECEDSLTQKLLLEAVVTGVGTKQFAENQPIQWSDVEPVLSGWAQDFKDRLNAVQGR
jgi:hypothetical protein